MPQYDPAGWEWYQEALAAKADTTGALAYPPIYNDQAMQGFYAYRPSKKQPPKPVAFWYKGGDLFCKIDNVAVKYGLDVWPACSRHPIEHGVYTDVIAGNPWPHEIRLDDNPESDSTLRATIGHNSGDADADLNAIKGNLLEWSDRAKAAIRKGAPETQEDADALADLATKLNDLIQEADKMRLAETDPLHKAWKDRVEKWNSFIKPALPYVSNLKQLVKVYLDKETKRRQDVARKAAEEAAAKAAQDAPGSAPPDPGEVATIAPVTVRAGTRGKTISSAKRTVVKFDDFPAAAAFFCTMESVPSNIYEAVMKNAYSVLSGGVTVPGAKLDTETVAR